jgi:hypothetical protein
MTQRAKQLAGGFIAMISLLLVFSALELIYPGALSSSSPDEERPIIRGMN